MIALCNRADHYIFILFLLSFFPCLISAVGDWMSTILPHTHGVALVRIYNAGLKNVLHAARWKYRTQKSRQKSPSRHLRTTLSGYIFATKACIDNRKKTEAPICPPHVLIIWWTYGPLTAEIGLTIWGTPTNLQLVSRLGSITARYLVVGVS